MSDPRLIYGFTVWQPETVESWRLKIDQTLRAILPKQVVDAVVVRGDGINFHGHRIWIEWNENITDHFVIGFLIHIGSQTHSFVENTYVPEFGTLAEVLTTRKKELDEILTQLIKEWGLGQWEPTQFGLYLST